VKLTNKQRLFIDYYLQSFNASDAARKAGYSEKTAGVIGHENLTKPEIQAEIQTRLSDVHMSAEEALKLLADIARGDMARMMDISSVGFSLDMQRARELGITKLIKRVKQKTTTFIAKKESEEDREVTELEVELYDALGAIRDVLKVHGKFVDKMEVGGQNGVPLEIVIRKASEVGPGSQ
jgi:hypothetical protein